MITAAARKLAPILTRAAWAALVLGLLLHLTIRDSIDGIAVVFYMLPLPVLIGLAVYVFLLSKGRCKSRLAAGVLGIVILVSWLSRSWCSHTAPPMSAESAPKEFRVLFWNLGRPHRVSTELIALVKELQPDVIGCAEPGEGFMEHEAAYEAALPGYDCELSPRGLVFLSRWPMRMRGRGKLDGMGAFVMYDITTPQRVMRVVLSDVYAAPLMSRRKSLAETLGHAEGDTHCIIMGDLNTPRESAHFAGYEKTLQHAFDTAGNGFRETWFWRLPLLSLDHIWLGADWRVIETQKIHRWSSDHAALFTRMER